MKDKKWVAYWKFMLSKAFWTGMQSAISLYRANSTGIIDADLMELLGVSFLSGFITVIQHALEQYKPKATYEQGAWPELGYNSELMLGIS